MLKRIRFYIVILITITLLYLVLRKIGLEELIDTLRQADPRYLLLSILLTPFMQLISVIKWHMLIRVQNIKVSFWLLIKLYLVGIFFNNFLPSNVGGDVVRIYELGRQTGDPARAAASVFVERATGFITLIVLACVSFVANLSLIEEATLSLVMLASVVALVALLWIIIDFRLLRFVASQIPFSAFQKLVRKFEKFHDGLVAFKPYRKTLIATFALSLVYYVGAVLNVYLSARTFHLGVQILDMAIIVPIIMIVAMLPISFNSIGVQEWAYVLLFGWLGLPSSVGLSTILLIRAKSITLAILGGLFYPTIQFRQQNSGSYEQVQPLP